MVRKNHKKKLKYEMKQNSVGIILAGGEGTRLRPMTKIINKHLLPVFDKPMIFYSLSTLLLSGVTEIYIVVRPNDLKSFTSILKEFDRGVYNIKFVFQFTFSESKPRLGDSSNFNILSCNITRMHLNREQHL